MVTATHSQYLSNATCVVSFAIDRNIRYRVSDIEKAFQKIASAQATSTNVPDSAPPALPRFTMASGPKQIAISQIGAQLDLDFFGQKKTFGDLYQTIKKNFSYFWNGICQLKEMADIRDIGMIIKISIPSKKDPAELSEIIFDRFIKAPKLGSSASTSFQLGFLDTDKQAFVNITLGPYEIREGIINSTGQQVTVNPEELPITERGIEIKLDVNSKPYKLENGTLPLDLDDQLLSRLNELLTDRCKDFLNW